MLSNSRGPETLADLVSALGPRASAATSGAAAAAGDLVVVPVPVEAFPDLRPRGALDRSCLPVAGDSGSAKAAVTAFIRINDRPAAADAA